MKQAFDSLSSTLIARAKNPFIGSLFLCFVGINYKGLTMFWLSDTAQRMQIIQAYSYSKLLEDLGQAFAMAILYIAFTKWVIPIIHLVIDFCKFAMIDPFLSWFQTEMLSRKHRAAEKTNRLQIRSELEYLRKEEDFKLHQWKSHKDTLLDLVRDLRKEVSDGKKLVSEARERATQRNVEIDSLKAQLQANIDYKDNYEHYKAVVVTINFGFKKSMMILFRCSSLTK